MENVKMSLEQAIALILADAKKDETLLIEVRKLNSRFEDLRKKKKVGTISAKDFEKELQTISDQLDELINNDLRDEHTNYETLTKELYQD